MLRRFFIYSGVLLVLSAFYFFVNAKAEPFAPADPVSASISDTSSVFKLGEELEYDVTFLSFRLGKIIIKMDSMVVENGHNVWIPHIYVDSREGIPFVSLHEILESHIDEAGYSRYFLASFKNRSEKGWGYLQYMFDYPDQKITIDKKDGEKIPEHIDIHAPYKYNDGVSLIYYVRRNMMYRKYVGVPTLVETDSAHTFIHFLGERESQNIDAVNYPVDCLHFTGDAQWTGIYGLTG
ncbi:MAG TPA: DUF3108 domain-containing protein, partial [Candidatus Kapabacteria bacterium]|nr:DUF3108 domain-containing protein [Candidatus Kapabacteria bacterium]